jgi:hypothetical protein
MKQLTKEQADERDHIIADGGYWLRYDFRPEAESFIVNAKTPSYQGGVASFCNVSTETLRRLVDSGYADPDDAQNDAPTTGRLLEWLESHPSFTAHGYTVSHQREDCRVSLEGVELNRAPTAQEREDFLALVSEGSPDGGIDGEVVDGPNRLYVWWD